MPLNQLNLATEYRTSSRDTLDPVAAFYIPALAEARTYLRAAGYFRSSILSLTGPAFIEFARRGGTATLVCSPKLEPQDVEAIHAGQSTHREAVERQLVQDVQALLSAEDLAEPAVVLATLVSIGAIDVLIAYRPDADGMYHEKIGCFLDDNDNRVSFIGSANETYAAWSTRGNFESIEVFCSWHSERDKARTANHETYLRNLIANRVPGISVIEFPEAARQKLFEKARDSIEDLSKPRSKEGTYHLGKEPLPHQVESLASWNGSGCRGIFQHATGSGKTFTAILAIADHVQTGNPTLVVVPSQLLQEQWTREILQALPDAIVLLAGGGHQRWRAPYALAGQTAPGTTGRPRITIAIMATAALKEFSAKLIQGSHLLVIADEVHQLGSPEYSKFFMVSSGKRLGLSATPQRFGDPEGTRRILDYFGEILRPIVTLKDAIDAKRLVPYEYHVTGVRLTDEEADSWRALTKRIMFALSGDNEARSSGLSHEATRLLVQRSRIAKKASRKIEASAQLIKEHYQDKERWLIYCEDVAHMEELAATLRATGIACTLYHSAMAADRNETLRGFEMNGGIILAVRCLDEGIDIPSVTHALLIASSQNPRQFIQRRGRILRRHPGKERATLYDIIVLPVDDDNDPLGALESEFSRAVGFANDALNQGEHGKLIQLALESGVDLSQHYPEIAEDLDNENT